MAFRESSWTAAVSLISLVVVPLASCQAREPVVDFEPVKRRPPCESLPVVNVAQLADLADEDCDHEGQALIFPGGCEIVVGPLSSVRTITESIDLKAVDTLCNYGAKGVVLSWTECDGDPEPVLWRFGTHQTCNDDIGRGQSCTERVLIE